MIKLNVAKTGCVALILGLLVLSLPLKAEEKLDAIGQAAVEAEKSAQRAAAADRKAEETRNANAALAKAKEDCADKGGDWKKGKCIMPPPPKPKPIPPVTTETETTNPEVTSTVVEMQQQRCKADGGVWNNGTCEKITTVMPQPAKPISQPPPVVEKPSASVSSGRYRVNGNGAVTDTQTGLMWKQCSEGQSGSGCAGEATKYKWDDAMSRFSGGVSFAGYSDWRMPTIEELRTLVYCSNGTPSDKACDADKEYDAGCAGKNYQFGKYESPTIDLSVFQNTDKLMLRSPTASRLYFRYEPNTP